MEGVPRMLRRADHDRRSCCPKERSKNSKEFVAMLKKEEEHEHTESTLELEDSHNSISVFGDWNETEKPKKSSSKSKTESSSSSDDDLPQAHVKPIKRTFAQAMKIAREEAKRRMMAAKAAAQH
jgi:hypothetical protein